VHDLDRAVTDLRFPQRPVKRSPPRFKAVNSDHYREPLLLSHDRYSFL